MTEQQLKALVVRAGKSFLFAFSSVFLLGLTSVVSSVLSIGGTISGAKSALLALVAASLTAGFSAIVNLYIKPTEAK